MGRIQDLYQGEVWYSADGVHRIAEMDLGHVKNVVRWLKNHATSLAREHAAHLSGLVLPEGEMALHDVSGAIESELDQMAHDPVVWLNDTPLMRALCERISPQQQNPEGESAVESNAFPWIKHLPSEEAYDFVAELRHLFEECPSNTKILGRMDTLIAAWRSTAQVHADPELRAALMQSSDSGADLPPSRYGEGDIIRQERGFRRWEVMAVGPEAYFVRALHTAPREPRDTAWNRSACEGMTKLEWSPQKQRGTTGWCGHSYEGLGPCVCGEDVSPDKDD